MHSKQTRTRTLAHDPIMHAHTDRLQCCELANVLRIFNHQIDTKLVNKMVIQMVLIQQALARSRQKTKCKTIIFPAIIVKVETQKSVTLRSVCKVAAV